MEDKSNISAHNFEQCIKCAICTEVCPVLRAVPSIYPGPKKSGPDSERLRLKNSLFFDNNLEYCLNCKRCEVACPSEVKVADIIHSARETYSEKKTSLRDAMLSNTDLVGSLAVPFAGVVNLVTGNPLVKRVLDLSIGIDHRRTFPKYSSKKFTDIFERDLKDSQEKYKKKLSYFHGCYANYNYPQLGIDFVKVANALGYGVELLEDERCCSVAMISAGMFSSARKNAERNIESMRKAIEKGNKIITTSTTCTLTMRDEYKEILGIDNSDVRDNIVLAEKFIYELTEEENSNLIFKKGKKTKVAYHIPCHMEKLGWSIFTINLLRRIPGIELTVLDSCCCGIAGTYGFKKEKYEISQAIGEPLFNQIRSVNPNFVVCECETCKWQIEMSTGYKVVNPISLLSETLNLKKTERENIKLQV